MRIAVVLLLSACSFDGTSPGDPPMVNDGGNPAADAAANGVDAPPNANAFRRDIRITPPPNVMGDVQDVALPIRLSADTHFMDNASATGEDIMVQTESGISLPIDFEILDVANGDMLAWVVVPDVLRSGTDVFLFYGGGQMAPANNTNPWEGLSDTVWHFDTIGAGPTTIDVSPSGFDGTVTASGSLAIAPGVHGNAYDYTSTQILMDEDDSLDRDANDSFTTALWFNQQNALSTFDFTFYNGGPIDDAPGYEFSFGTGNWTAGIRDVDDDNLVLVFGNESALGGAGWLHLVLVVDRNDDTATAYVNGNQVDTGSIANIGDLRNNDRRARIGGGANPPDALIDEFRAYPRALSTDDVVLDHALGADQSVVTIGAPTPVRYPGT